MATQVMTPLRARRLADLAAMAEGGAVLFWGDLAEAWGLAGAAQARAAVSHVPGVRVGGGFVTLPDGQKVKIADQGTRRGGPTLAQRRGDALAALERMADRGEMLHMPHFAQVLGYSGATGARFMLSRLPGVVLTQDTVVLPDGRTVRRLREGEKLTVIAQRETLLGLLREVADSGAALSWREMAGKAAYDTEIACRKAVMRLPGVRRAGAALVVPGIGEIPVAPSARKRSAPASRKVRRAPTPRRPKEPRRSSVSSASAAASERMARVLAHLEGMVGPDMPRREDAAKALGISVAAVRYALEQLQSRGAMARVPGGWRLPSGRVLRKARAGNVGRPVSAKRKAVPVPPPEVAGAADKLTPTAEVLTLPAKVPALADWPGAHECRWPIGEMRSEAGLSFCRSKTDGRTYCAYHDARAHVRPALVAEAAE